MKTHCLINKTGIEIDIGIKPTVYKIFVLERHTFQINRYIDQGISPRYFKHLVSKASDDLRSRVVIFVHSMPEAHEPFLTTLDPLNEFIDIIAGADPSEHPKRGLIGSPMERAI